jgi:hypothetical protein
MHHYRVAILVATMGMESFGSETTADECHLGSSLLFCDHRSEQRVFGPGQRTPSCGE